MRLRDKVAIITGAAQGIGAAFAEGYSKEGAKVVIADVMDGSAVIETIEKTGGEAIYVKTDVTQQDDCTVMAKAAVERFGGIDILVNNAAMYGNIVKKPFMEITTEEWNRVMEVNTTGPFHCLKAVFPYMKDKGGRIINIGSSVVLEAPPFFPHYVASKGAILTFTRCMAKELGSYNINVNTLAPGYTQSQGSKKIEKRRITRGPSAEEITLDKRCLKKSSLPEYMVGTAIYLASEDSTFVTGQLVLVDGGSAFH